MNSLKEDLKKLQGFTKAYVQLYDGLLVNDSAFCYVNGLKTLKIPIEYFDVNEKKDLIINKETLVVAGINPTLRAFQSIGVVPPKPLDLPEELIKYCEREIFYTTIGESLKMDLKFPVFVKPSSHGKLFDGQLMYTKNDIELFKYLDPLEDEIPIIVSEPVEFISEYRTFVLEGKILDSRRYMGSYRVLPNYSIIERAVQDYKHSPIAYAIDFGVTKDGRTLLIECNDAYSLGPYGFNNFDLTRMFIMRWKEIIGII